MLREIKITKSITSRADQVERYLAEINKISLIPPDEEVALAIRIKAGDQKAFDALVEANLRFVVSVAKQYQYSGSSLNDLINEGNLGLMKAAQRFDPSKGLKFISFAVWWIRQSIMQALVERGRMVRVPCNKIQAIGKVQRRADALLQEHEWEPSAEDLAESLHMTSDAVAQLLALSKGHHESLDQPLSEDSDETLGTFQKSEEPSPDEPLDQESLEYKVKALLQNFLRKREQEIFWLFYGIGGGEPLSIKKIAEQYNRTPELIRQIIKRAEEKLREKAPFLKEYFST